MSDSNISGSFIFSFPFENDECKHGVTSCQKLFVCENKEEIKFYPVDLAALIKALNELHYSV